MPSVVDLRMKEIEGIDVKLSGADVLRGLYRQRKKGSKAKLLTFQPLRFIEQYPIVRIQIVTSSQHRFNLDR